MSFKKPIQTLPLTFPRLRVTDGVSDFYQSKVEKQRLKYRPKWDLARDSAAAALLEARRKFASTLKTLERKRKSSIKIRRFLNNQWADLAEKETAYKLSFKKFNQFVRENHEKRERAARKTADDILLQERRQQNIETITAKMKHVVDIKIMMEARIKEYRMYEDFMQKVAKTASEFKNLSDVLFRYEALSDAKIRLTRIQETNLSSLESAKNNLVKLAERNKLELIGLQNTLCGMEIRYTSAKARSLMWENIVTQIQDHCSFKLAEQRWVKDGLYNVYLRMCQRQNVEAELDRCDVKNQLVFINTSLRQLDSVTTQLRRATLHKQN